MKKPPDEDDGLLIEPKEQQPKASDFFENPRINYDIPPGFRCFVCEERVGQRIYLERPICKKCYQRVVKTDPDRPKKKRGPKRKTDEERQRQPVA